MTRFEDPRAEYIVAQIDSINAIGWQSNCDKAVLQQDTLKDNLSPANCVLHSSTSLERANQTANKVKAVWAEQRELNISGIEWYTLEYGRKKVELPRLSYDLTLVPGDKEILVQSKPLAYDFLAYCNQFFLLWRYDRSDNKYWNQTQWIDFQQEYLFREWVEIWVENDISIVLFQNGICPEESSIAINACCYWGDPLAVHRTATYSKYAGSSWFVWGKDK
ncbi:hypothetical protein [Nostoc sp.]|uniref:hypothetical protein n=1 Tax=Nostoc sp. TaxID=1180 RepID=UPI002FF56F9B